MYFKLFWSLLILDLLELKLGNRAFWRILGISDFALVIQRSPMLPREDPHLAVSLVFVGVEFHSPTHPTLPWWVHLPLQELSYHVLGSPSALCTHLPAQEGADMQGGDTQGRPCPQVGCAICRRRQWDVSATQPFSCCVCSVALAAFGAGIAPGTGIYCFVLKCNFQSKTSRFSRGRSCSASCCTQTPCILWWSLELFPLEEKPCPLSCWGWFLIESHSSAWLESSPAICRPHMRALVCAGFTVSQWQPWLAMAPPWCGWPSTTLQRGQGA